MLVFVATSNIPFKEHINVQSAFIRPKSTTELGTINANVRERVVTKNEGYLLRSIWQRKSVRKHLYSVAHDRLATTPRLFTCRLIFGLVGRDHRSSVICTSGISSSITCFGTTKDPTKFCVVFPTTTCSSAQAAENCGFTKPTLKQ